MGKENIIMRTLGDAVISLIPGKVLDNNNAHEVVETIVKAQEDGYRYIIIDMADMEFISSAGVGSILGTIEGFRENDGDIILCNVPDAIMHVFDVLDLADFLTIKNTEREAAGVCGVNI